MFLSLALPLLVSGIRTTTVQAIGLAVVAALIGAGGFGAIMFQGLLSSALDLVLLGVLPVVGLASDRSVLVLGRLSDDPKSHYEQLKPLLDYVVPRLRDVGIVEGRILMAKDVQQMSSYLRRGRVDWVTETSGAIVMTPWERTNADLMGTIGYEVTCLIAGRVTRASE